MSQTCLGKLMIEEIPDILTFWPLSHWACHAQ